MVDQEVQTLISSFFLKEGLLMQLLFIQFIYFLVNLAAHS